MRTVRGLTLLEVLIAIFIVGVAVLAAIMLQHTAFRATSKARIAKAATAIIRERIEHIRSRPSDLSILCVNNRKIGNFTLNCIKIPCSLTNNKGATEVTCANGENADLYEIKMTLTHSTGSHIKVITYIKGE